MEVIEWLLRYEDYFNSPDALKLLREWTDLQLLTKRTKDGDEKDAILEKIKKFPNVEWVEEVLHFSFCNIHPSQLGGFVSLLVGLQSFQQLTKSNVINSSIIKNGVKCDSKMPKITAPTTAITTIAHKLKLIYLDDELNKYGYQSVTHYKGEIEAFYMFFETERYQLLSQKHNQKPLFHGQHKAHMQIELKTENAMICFNNQFAPSLIHRGSLGVERTNSFLGAQFFPRGKKGLKRTYMHITKAKVCHNLGQFIYWEKLKFKKLSWSKQIIDDFDDVRQALYNLPYVVREMRHNGYYVIKDVQDDILPQIKKQVLNHELVFTNQPIWKPEYHVRLYFHLMEKPKEWKFNEDTLQELVGLFRNQFDRDFMLRRCQTWGFYLE